MDVHPLGATDLDVADEIFRDAFGTFLGSDVFGDTDLLRTRFRAGHTTVLGAYHGSDLVGSNVVSRWGDVGWFGPLSVAPKLWDAGVGSRLMVATMEVFADWGVTHQGLFTFAHSPRHHGLYQKFGFWPRFLTAIMSRQVTGSEPPAGRLLSAAEDRAAAVAGCLAVTDALHAGLDVTGEIGSVLDQGLGDVVLVGDPDAPSGLAVCHTGAGSEAGTGIAFVKFAAVTPGPQARDAFDSLLAACQGWAAAAGARRLVAGVNTGRHDAYRHLLASGFRTDTPGVTMHRPNGPGYDRPDAYVLDDWR
ncbi:GNAT family N-acetyltransferase [Pseudonocardia sp. KRD-169]|uniref:GNAT family N-acetyltransferase n=1 Tax=Pseudonocardia abyssalis TaxID=2792008 RepID=A0ABS6UNQ7_9PSEU|nr:GNAT family N-acetyltransferase [Pseudonocardia abyssalis]MBW0133528.1 GNAT family N-acetyltransferase [Pseudonocardia abyssalis]